MFSIQITLEKRNDILYFFHQQDIMKQRFTIKKEETLSMTDSIN